MTLRLPLLLITAAVLLAASPALAGCGTCEGDAAAPATPHAHPGGAAPAIAATHGGDLYAAHAAVSADFDLAFEGMFEMKGHIVFDTPAGRSKITLDNGTTITFDGESATVSPADAPLPAGMGRFHALTWPYFMAAPFKLGDPGAQLAEVGTQPWDEGNARPAQMLTFGDNVGDAPDDWYLVFSDEQHHLRGMAYIVTYGQELAEAAKKPHAIVYGGYQDLDGVLLSTRWTFYNWNETDGLNGPVLGTGKFTNVKFVDIDDSTFAHPEDARVDDAI